MNLIISSVVVIITITITKFVIIITSSSISQVILNVGLQGIEVTVLATIITNILKIIIGITASDPCYAVRPTLEAGEVEAWAKAGEGEASEVGEGEGLDVVMVEVLVTAVATATGEGLERVAAGGLGGAKETVVGAEGKEVETCSRVPSN